MLTLQLKGAADAERRHLLLEVLASLSDSGETSSTGHRGSGGRLLYHLQPPPQAQTLVALFQTL